MERKKLGACVGLLLGLALLVGAQNVSNYMEQGGAKWVVLGQLQFGNTVSTPAVYMGGGTNAAPLTTSTADVNFLDFRTETTATSGTSRGLYLRHYLGDTTPSGEAARIFATVNAAGATDAHGEHVSLSYGASGTCTGESAALRSTFQVPDKVLGGTNGALYTELWADGTSSDMSNGQFQRYVFGGNATGIGKLDDSTALFSIEGGSVGSGNLVVSSTATAAVAIRIRVNGTPYYLLAASAP